MKKRMSRMIFVLLCFVMFVISAVLSFGVTYRNILERPFRYLKVKEDASLWRAEYDLESDGNVSTKYDLYLPAAVDKNKNYSLIFFIHGGGFTSGDKEDGKRICPYYAAKGMIAVSANYSLSNEKSAADINLMFDELQNTIFSVKEYCSQLGYNITEMATTGESAGGCLALLLAYRKPETLAVPVKFAFVQSAPVCFDPTEWGLGEPKDFADFVSKLSGKDFVEKDIGSEKYNAAIDEISPSAWVNADSVPCILAYGPRDIIVPPQVKYQLFEKLDKMNITYRYIEFPNSGHGLLHDPDKSEEYYSFADEYMKKYFENK